MKLRIIATGILLICATITQAQNYQFASTEREDGTAFFSLDGRNGQLYWMIDYGDSRGVWKTYGPPIADLGEGRSFAFDANEREDGTVFFAMDSQNGQIYWMLDYGDSRGTWKPYGTPIGNSKFSFQANEREDGTAFFAVDQKTGQLHFMLDYGDSRGNWKPYGNTPAN